MYQILGSDQKEYGPAPASVIERWIAERRLDARSQIRRQGEPIWRPLRDFPEFTQALASSAKKAPVRTGTTSTISTEGPPRTSGLAITALVIGILAPCTAGLAGLFGVIFGIAALKKIARGGGRLQGRGLAWTGLIISAVFLVAIPPFVISAFVAQQRARHLGFAGGDPAQECLEHARQLAEAIRRSANDNNDRFPDGGTWCDVVQSGIAGLNTFQCPNRGDLRSGFALNSAVANKSRFEISPETVLLFESDRGWNANGGPAVAIGNPRHGLVTVVLVDGSTRQIPAQDLPSLRWQP